MGPNAGEILERRGGVFGSVKTTIQKKEDQMEKPRPPTRRAGLQHFAQ